ncbi:MAG: arylsulfatase A-like enzyme [Verrucomicrobiales bacterium]|jgi:arylsulfatase A-like enzyme
MHGVRTIQSSMMLDVYLWTINHRSMKSLLLFFCGIFHAVAVQPNIVLVMTDDQGWGETSYYDHPVLKTPHLDAMVANGLRFDRFYAGAPVCSPTRASVLTGRSNMLTGVNSHGYALRRQEPTVAMALRKAGYATGHFGKWHLNGMRGPGVPVFANDTHHPGVFGFDTWLSVTNFFDRDPIMSRQGVFEEFTGDSSEIIVREALTFIQKQAAAEKPSFSVIWYGTPHSPFVASDEDKAPFANLDKNSQNHYGELVAMDRSIGALRQGLRDAGIAKDTLVWFCSDNGGLPKISPATVGGLRGFKGSVYEGGLRVPAILEWPAEIVPGRVTKFPAVTMDIYPTIAAIVNLPETSLLQPHDGMSLKGLFKGTLAKREKPIPFHCLGNSAWLDYPHKLVHMGKKNAEAYELYHLENDPLEKTNLYESNAEEAKRMRAGHDAWLGSMRRSIAGQDYSEGKLLPGDPEPRHWADIDAYRPYFESWQKRPEYGDWLRKQLTLP